MILHQKNNPGTVNSRNIIIIRGVSSSGKSSFAEFIKELYPDSEIYCADDYFHTNYDGSNPDGVYKFNSEKLGAAHGACRRKFQKAVDTGAKCVIVANTNTKKSDWEFYEEYGKQNNYRVFFIVLENRHNGVNIHSVNESTLIKQENNIKNSLKLR